MPPRPARSSVAQIATHTVSRTVEGQAAGDDTERPTPVHCDPMARYMFYTTEICLMYVCIYRATEIIALGVMIFPNSSLRAQLTPVQL